MEPGRARQAAWPTVAALVLAAVVLVPVLLVVAGNLGFRYRSRRSFELARSLAGAYCPCAGDFAAWAEAGASVRCECVPDAGKGGVVTLSARVRAGRVVQFELWSEPRQIRCADPREAGECDHLVP